MQKKVDLIIEYEGKTLPVQVKALAKKQNVGWPLKLEHKYEKSLIFVLVVLGKPGTLPDYYVLTGADVQKKRKDYSGRSIINITDASAFKDNWKLIESKLS